MQVNVKRSCPERLEQELEDKGTLEESLKEATKDLSEMVRFRGFKRFKDYVEYRNGIDQDVLDCADLLDADYGKKAMLTSAVKKARADLIGYLEDKLTDRLQIDAEEMTKKEGKKGKKNKS